jgi:hypothetical protein
VYTFIDPILDEIREGGEREGGFDNWICDISSGECECVFRDIGHRKGLSEVWSFQLRDVVMVSFKCHSGPSLLEAYQIHVRK